MRLEVLGCIHVSSTIHGQTINPNENRIKTYKNQRIMFIYSFLYLIHNWIYLDMLYDLIQSHQNLVSLFWLLVAGIQREYDLQICYQNQGSLIDTALLDLFGEDKLIVFSIIKKNICVKANSVGRPIMLDQCPSKITHFIFHIYGIVLGQIKIIKTMILNHTRCGVKISEDTKGTIADHPVAKLMYYLDSVCKLLPIDEERKLSRLRNYGNYYLLDEDDLVALIALCVLFDPKELIDKCIFVAPQLLGNSENEFLEFQEVSNILGVADDIVIGGKVKKVTKIMVCKGIWLKKYFLDPFLEIHNKITKSKAIKSSPASKPTSKSTYNSTSDYTSRPKSYHPIKPVDSDGNCCSIM